VEVLVEAVIEVWVANGVENGVNALSPTAVPALAVAVRTIVRLCRANMDWMTSRIGTVARPPFLDYLGQSKRARERVMEDGWVVLGEVYCRGGGGGGGGGGGCGGGGMLGPGWS
jgi:hypothetical protein